MKIQKVIPKAHGIEVMNVHYTEKGSVELREY